MGGRAWWRWAAIFSILANLSSTLCAQSEEPSVLNDQVARLYEAGKYPEAIPIAQHALDLAEKLRAPDPVVAAALDNLALLYKVQGRYAEAEPLYKRALDLHRKMPHDPDFPTALNNLAMLYVAQGRYAEAEPQYNRALDLWKKALGPNNPAVATALNNLAQLYDHQGRYAEAEPLYKRALEIREKEFGPDDPAVARTLNYLALLYEHQGRYAEAEPLYKRGLAIAEKALGLDHPTVARIRENLGGLYKSLGRRGEAEPLLRSALTIKEQALGPDNPQLASTLGQLGDLYRIIGKCSEAEKQFARAHAVAGPTIEDIPVLFGTDRKRDDGKPSLAFGRERSKSMSFGVVVVTVPNPKRPTQAARQQPSEKGTVLIASADAEAATRLPQTCSSEPTNDLRRLFEDPSRSKPKQALIFIHGYNVSFENAVRRAAQIAYDIKFAGNVFAFSWPSHGRFWGYFSDSETVNLAVGDLADFLKKIVAEAKPTKIHFIAHSMGNMVLLRALEKLTQAQESLRPLMGEVINAAPDVEPEYFAQLVETIIGKNADGEPAKMTRPTGNFTLYAAQSDWALWASSWIWGRRAGLIDDQPLIAPGVDTIDITKGGRSAWRYFDINHDIYMSSPIIVSDMQGIIERSARPPDKRTNELEPVLSSQGTYWVLRSRQVDAQR